MSKSQKLVYDSNTPAFLQRLRGQMPSDIGERSDDRAGRAIPARLAMRSGGSGGGNGGAGDPNGGTDNGDEDGPIYVMEGTGDVVSSTEYAAMVDGVEKGDSVAEVTAAESTTTTTATETAAATAVTTSTRPKRKLGRIIATQDDDDEGEQTGTRGTIPRDTTDLPTLEAPKKPKPTSSSLTADNTIKQDGKQKATTKKKRKIQPNRAALSFGDDDDDEQR